MAHGSLLVLLDVRCTFEQSGKVSSWRVKSRLKDEGYVFGQPVILHRGVYQSWPNIRISWNDAYSCTLGLGLLSVPSSSTFEKVPAYRSSEVCIKLMMDGLSIND